VRTPRCPTCQKALSEDTGSLPFPFCSQRCKLVDLHGWLNDRYVVSRELMPDDSEDLVRADDE
jgi:endogenous inhibitor of DNA gyrase (YacG/DUF329 family)